MWSATVHSIGHRTGIYVAGNRGLVGSAVCRHLDAQGFGILHVQAMRRQHGHRWISAMPTNLYGPGDNFDLSGSHVLPAMIRKFHDAKTTGAPVTLWGTGTPRREFLHVDDMAAACLHLLE